MKDKIIERISARKLSAFNKKLKNKHKYCKTYEKKRKASLFAKAFISLI